MHGHLEENPTMLNGANVHRKDSLWELASLSSFEEH